MKPLYGILVLLLIVFSCSPEKDKAEQSEIDSLAAVSNANAVDPVRIEGDYPFLSIWVITLAKDLPHVSAHDLRFARNEIFARHGYIFKSEDLKKHFSAKPWYRPRFDNVDDKLTEIEKANIALILEAETRNRHTPLAKFIRNLPFLTLPIDLSEGYSDLAVSRDTSITAPNGTLEMRELTYYGLLPDTSRIYAVLWSGAEVYENLEDPEPIKMFVTTLDKNSNEIQTFAIWVEVLMTEEDLGNQCTLQHTSSAVLRRDWTFHSKFVTVRSCPTAGDDLETQFGEEISGRIEKYGTIIRD